MFNFSSFLHAFIIGNKINCLVSIHYATLLRNTFTYILINSKKKKKNNLGADINFLSEKTKVIKNLTTCPKSVNYKSKEFFIILVVTIRHIICHVASLLLLYFKKNCLFGF
jgi:hypothetical protein